MVTKVGIELLEQLKKQVKDDFLFSIYATILLVGTEHLGNFDTFKDNCEKIDEVDLPPSSKLTTRWDVNCLGRGRGGRRVEVKQGKLWETIK